MSIRKASLALVAAFGLTGAVNALPLINGLGGDTGFGENYLARNDDGSTAFIEATSIFTGCLNFFGTSYNGFYLRFKGGDLRRPI